MYIYNYHEFDLDIDLENDMRAVVLVVCALFSATGVASMYPKCLDYPAAEQRNFINNGRNLPLILQSSERFTHHVTSQITRILLHDVMGYGRVEIHYEAEEPFDPLSLVDQLSGCAGERCQEVRRAAVPQTMINMEVPLTATFDLDLDLQLSGKKSLIDRAGFLGTSLRFGVFMTSRTVDRLWDLQIIGDHWRSLGSEVMTSQLNQGQILKKILTTKSHVLSCQMPDCETGIFHGPGCHDNNNCTLILAKHKGDGSRLLMKTLTDLSISVTIAWVGKHFNDIVNDLIRKDSDIIVFASDLDLEAFKVKFQQVYIPTCADPQTSAGCLGDVRPLHKFLWHNITSNAPDVFSFISKFHIPQLHFLSFIQNSSDLSPFDLGCEWVKDNANIWKDWVPNVLKPKIYLLGLFPIHGNKWSQPGVSQGAQLAVSRVNMDAHILPQYDLELLVKDSHCDTKTALKQYIQFLQYYDKQPIAGILGPACSGEAEVLASLSSHLNMLTISYAAEAMSLSDRVLYPFFFRTIPPISVNIHVLRELFRKMSWKFIGALAEYGEILPQYQSQLQKVLEADGRALIRHNVGSGESGTRNIIQVLDDMKTMGIKIIVADLYDEAARIVMCEAYKRRMTAKEGFVWFLPFWLNWSNIDALPGSRYYSSQSIHNLPCNQSQIRSAIEGHFILSKSFYDSDQSMIAGNITIGQFKKEYAKLLGQERVQRSAFAGYAYDAVWVYAKALDKLLRQESQNVEHLQDQKMIGAYTSFINQTDFHGVSGKINFHGNDRLGSINILQYFNNGSRTVGTYDPVLRKLHFRDNLVEWLSPGAKPPKEVPTEVSMCPVEKFRQIFSISCFAAMVILITLFALAVLTCILGIILVLRRRFVKERVAKETQESMFQRKDSGLAAMFALDKWELDRDKVITNRKLGEGAFGVVLGGEALLGAECWIPVAVKTLKVGSRLEEKVDFLSEAEIMRRFDHPNIVKLLGVCTRGEPVYAIMEYHLHGDLKTYLLSRRSLVGQNTREAEDISPERLTRMVLDVANGLKYIHDMKYVHRDVACRNCLVHSTLTVKLSDFGMTRPLIESDYYRYAKKGMLPVRWMSPESLSDGMFTPKSDIWSFGVLIYEVMTFGSFPYQGMTNQQVMDFVKRRQRLILHTNYPEELCTFIYTCLSYEPVDRPDIDEIMEHLVRNPRFIQACLDAPTCSVITPDSDSYLTKSNTLPSLIFNRLSQTSQDIKRLSTSSQGAKVTTPTKISIKTLMPGNASRLQSSSLDTLNSACKRDYCPKKNLDLTTDMEAFQCPLYQDGWHKSQGEDSGLPLLGRGLENTSDYFSEVIKDPTPYTSPELCETVTSV